MFATDFRRIFKNKIYLKSFQRKTSCCMRMDERTDRQTDMTKLIVPIAILRTYLKNLYSCTVHF